MIAVAAVVVLVAVVLAVGASRFVGSRAERRSLDTYERTLDLLGDVAKRSDAVADVHVPTKDELARPHVRPALGKPLPPPVGSAVRIVPPARSRLDPPSLPGQLAGAMPVFGDPDLVADGSRPLAGPGLSERAGPPAGLTPGADPPTEVLAAVPAASAVGAGSGEAAKALDEQPVFDFDDIGTEPDGIAPRAKGRRAYVVARGGDRRVRRATARAAAAVALVALGVGGWQLESHSSPPVALAPQQPATATTVAPAASRAGHAGATTLPPARPQRPAAFRPMSTSASLVTYAAPSGPYTITFRATGGTCWLGAQQQVVSNTYLQMWTLASGESASYRASGALVVKIGAPRYVSISVAGEPVVLPPGNVQPYDISFTTGTGTPA
ncbi:MAG TPA: hypothetical protein VND23_12065 [Acidimicrobiales bacterium]|nr:hypothetical protein [Acidimicrobiales bacterium]